MTLFGIKVAFLKGSIKINNIIMYHNQRDLYSWKQNHSLKQHFNFNDDERKNIECLVEI